MIQKKSLKEAIKNPEIISVVGELINKQKLYPFQKMNSIGGNVDFDTFDKMGLYHIFAPTGAHKPGSIEYGLLVVYEYSAYVAQKAIDVVNNSELIRVRTEAKWTEWRTIL